MSERRYKFGSLDSTGEREHIYPGVYRIQRTSRSARLIIAPRDRQVGLLLDLAEALPTPLGILYILNMGRGENARYQCPDLLTRREAYEFFNHFRQFLEQDGRHCVWLASPLTDGNLVYDQHNLIYAYGPLKEFERILIDEDLTSGDVRLPYPHAHKYHTVYDDEAKNLLDYMDWIRTPLQEEDES